MLPVLDGFVLISVTGLILFEVIPHSMEEVGLWAIPLALIGLLVPTLIEKNHHRMARRAHDWARIFGVAAILFHSTIDGLALSLGTFDESSQGIALAVILHRLVEGMAIWWIVRPHYGRRLALGLIFAGVIVHGLGFFGGQSLQGILQNYPTGGLLALLGGALLHVLIHSASPKIDNSSRVPVLSAIGAIFGIIFLITNVTESVHVGTEHTHAHDGVSQLFASFMALARESAPALLLAYTVAGLVHALLPKTTIDWMSKGSNLQQSLRGMLFALPLPICSCGVLPLYRSLVDRGVPTAAAITLLIATPELGIDAVFLSVTLIDGPFALARVLAAAALAVFGGLLAVHYIPKLKKNTDQEAAPEQTDPLGKRIIGGLKVGLGDLVDGTAPWIILGLFLAAALAPLVADGTFLAGIPDLLKVPAFALLGLPVYVCASGATPLAAVLIAGGASPGAALAFLLTGPATNATTFGVLADLHGKKAAFLFAISVGLGAIACGYAVDAALPEVTVGNAVEHLGHDHHHEHGSEGLHLTDIALYGLGLLFLLSLFRKGPRPFMTQVFGVPTTDLGGAEEADSCCSTAILDPDSATSTPTEPDPPTPPSGGS
ncbi:hypothetical protein CBD41_01885 [bacterium TMED181]|nr:hypothetical protein [Planctomycetota bacterium]OUW46955.1 MAG: hypothetical protein CBD41_01885 [bacterium TMED181]